MVFGAKLNDMGKDVATFMDDSFDASREIAAVVEC